MVHWRWHPNAPPAQLSGTMFLNKDGRPTVITRWADKIVLVSAHDDDLDTWSEPVPVEPKVRPDQDGSTISIWDPDVWTEGGSVCQ